MDLYMRFVGSQEAGRGCNLVYVLITYPRFWSRDKFSAADDQRPFGIPFPSKLLLLRAIKFPPLSVNTSTSPKCPRIPVYWKGSKYNCSKGNKTQSGKPNPTTSFYSLNKIHRSSDDPLFHFQGKNSRLILCNRIPLS